MSDLKNSLNRSTDNRKAMISKFGFIPISVIDIGSGATIFGGSDEKNHLSNQMFIYQGQNPDVSRSTEKTMNNAIGLNGSKPLIVSDKSKERMRERMQMGITGGIVSAKADSITGTTLKPELISFYIKYYARKGQVFLDPFMGQGTAMQVAKYHHMHYHGCDVSETFFAFVDGVRAKIDDGKTDIKTFLCDSRFPDVIPDGIGDFSFYSPPYWDCEFYGTEAAQLGYKKSYQDFLIGMEQVARSWLPKFKQHAWHLVNVSDIRREGKFYPYHNDIINIYTRVGWEMHDIWIIEGSVTGLSRIFAVDFNMKRIAPKSHEYVLVFKKP